MNLIFYSILSLFCYLNSNKQAIQGQGDRATCQEVIECTPDRSVKIELGAGCRKDEILYEEGIMVTFTYPDTSYILVFCGRMQKFPILSDSDYIVENEKIDLSFKSRLGLNSRSNRYWREDNYGSGIAVIYDNVPDNQVEKFNVVLDNVKVSW